MSALELWDFTPIWVRGSWIIFNFQDVRPNQMSNFKSFIQASKCVLSHFVLLLPKSPFPNQVFYNLKTSQYHVTIPFYKFNFTLETVSNIWTNNMKPNVSLHHIWSYILVHVHVVYTFGAKPNMKYTIILTIYY